MPTSKVHSARSVVPAATASKSTKASARKPAAAKAKMSNSPSPGTGLPRKARKPASLPRSDGDAGVQAYIASMEPWQAAIAKRVDALVVTHVPGVRKAVRWHCPFYGVEGQGWFLAFAAFQYHIKFSFFRGTSLKLPPPIGHYKDVRSLEVRESDTLDEKQLATWIEQAASISGWDGGSRRGGGSPLQDENMTQSGASQGQSASELISKRIAELGDWRGETLSRMRTLIQDADPDVVEEWKWMGTPIWSHDGIICTGESYKHVVKLTFIKGASLKDPVRLFNSSLDGNARRAIDIHEGEEVDESAFKALVRQAVALNRSGKSTPPKKAKARHRRT
jgi:hypothetical protein